MMLTVTDVTVHYGTFEAVSGASLEIGDGEVFALLGPSGSGKSTLLRGIAGLEPLTGGTVAWDGTDLATTPVHRRGFGLVFQDGQLFPHRDVAGNVAFGPRMHGASREERAARVRELLELVGLAGYERRRVTELSGGQAQRVALARALAPRPRLLLLDEPLSGVDAELREQLAVDLAGLLRAAGVSTLLVTHDQEEAFALADRVAVLDGGRILQAGPVREVWRRPADDRVARFLGVTTVVDAHAADGVVTSPLGTLSMNVEDGPVRLGLRPGALRLDAGGDIAGEVVSLAHRRDHLRLTVRVAEGLVVQAMAPVLADPAPGDPVRLTADPDGVAITRPS
ncbi:ABC transporter ATP-binding protein [Amycolatopsis suaedae]|uniref:ABC-type quaternary amine transporter n=1 Tax=Amycolatopsis suaedae TaxID=2510978 RepID=A0A4V2EM32_9PSEU|nr:ABC transporter ATP-binding protein [Amycolatopsis suaedae]RZQ63655.1 ABC transporter ATP-binding protein [Amycolatopsis suaedae]